MAENTTLVSLPQLVDLSLNCHEGLIHFHALHALLHIVIQQSAMEDVTVEFRGKDGERLRGIINSTKPARGTRLTEYTVNGGGGKKRRLTKKTVSLQDVKEQHKMDKLEKLDKLETAKEKELRVIERRKNSSEDPELNPPPLKSPPASMYEEHHTMVLVDSASGLPQMSVAVTKDVFDNLKQDVAQIKEQVKELKEMPGNMGLIGATKDKNSPIQDMFQILTLTKRIEAVEGGLDKVGSIFEDLVRMMTSPDGGAKSPEFLDKIQDIKESIGGDSVSEVPASIQSVNVNVDLSAVEKRLDALEKYVYGFNLPETVSMEEEEREKHQDEDREKTDPEKESQEGGGDKSPSRPSFIRPDNRPVEQFKDSVVDGVNLGEMPVADALALLQQEMSNITAWVVRELEKCKNRGGGGGGGGHGSGGLGGGLGGSGGNVDALESRLSEYAKQLEALDAVYKNQMTLINQQMTSFKREVDTVVNKIDLVLPGGDSTGINAETTMELANKLLLLEKEILAVSEHASHLQAEKVELDKTIDAIMEQLDLLKIVKANREDLEDALGDKADACMINRKVSHDQFDAACDDLTRGIEEALHKLQEQEDMWRLALDTIQKDMVNKLDKTEVDPLRDFVNSKLKALQEKFKSLAAMKKEQEAAGTKSKLLRDVNCISCDKDVVMKKEVDPTMKPKPYAMPPPKNMAPYLAYELDQLRKQQKCIPGSKNLNFLESALKPKRDKEHVCNRYCGGSHTVTTPQQRVSRLGHFLEQWGPDIAPVQDEYIRGKDGQMYRARNDSVKKATKEEPQTGEGHTRPGSMSKDEKPQSERTTYISSSAEQLLTQDKVEKGPEELDKKTSIGATAYKIKSSTSAELKASRSVNKSIQGFDSEDPPPVGSLSRPSKTSEHKRIGFQE